jgi:H+/Cl- antiporter ClcA
MLIGLISGFLLWLPHPGYTALLPFLGIGLAGGCVSYWLCNLLVSIVMERRAEKGEGC